MAKPRVFISSTCHDLRHIREQMKYLVEDMGYEAVLSEEGDVFYSPDLHIQLSCLREVENCDIVILIIGTKFGNESILSDKMSVTQSEHQTAYIRSIPIFSFIEQRVFHDYQIYKKIIRKAKSEEKDPDVLIQEYPFGVCSDIRILMFIDDIIRKTSNNSYFPYSDFRDIKKLLKKQWAGMFFDFLQKRKKQSETDLILSLLSKIDIANFKVEQIVELLADSLPPDKINKDILNNIGKSADQQRLTLLFNDFWDCMNLSSGYLLKNTEIAEEIVDSLNELISKLNIDDKDSLRDFQKYLMDVEIVDKGDFYINYHAKYVASEINETIKRYTIDNETVVDIIKNSLYNNIIHQRNINAKECKLESVSK